MALIEISFNVPKNWKMGDSVYFVSDKGNLRRLIVEGFNDSKTSFVFSDPFLDEVLTILKG